MFRYAHTVMLLPGYMCNSTLLLGSMAVVIGLVLAQPQMDVCHLFIPGMVECLISFGFPDNRRLSMRRPPPCLEVRALLV